MAEVILRKCSFCNKSEIEVGQLVAGPGVAICDQCVALSSEIIGEQDTAGSPRQNKVTAGRAPIQLQLTVDSFEQYEAEAIASILRRLATDVLRRIEPPHEHLVAD